MGRLMLFLVAGLTFGLTTVLYNVQMGTGEAEDRVNEHAAKLLAREIALTGLADTEQQVLESYAASGSYVGPPTITGAYDDGTYAVEITTVAESITLKAIGHFRDARHTLSRSYTYNGSGSFVPPFMASPITVSGNILVNDDFTVRAPNLLSNANIHANGNIKFEDGTALVEGFGHYKGNLEMDNGQTAEDVFQPNVNSEGDPVHETVDAFDIPSFKADDFEGIATHTTYESVALMGNVTLGTADNPVIWYISGNVTTQSAVTFSGYGVIVVKGDVEIEHA